jgi:hypothetical protein
MYAQDRNLQNEAGKSIADAIFYVLRFPPE